MKLKTLLIMQIGSTLLSAIIRHIATFCLPISLKNLPSKKGVLLPEFKKQRRRLITKQIRKGDWKRKTMHCSNCNQTDHNIWKCQHAPAFNRRKQRARDRESSTSSSTSTSSLSTTSSNSSRLDINSNDMQDLQFQAEMDRYDELYARAKKVAERERQRLELEALKSGDNNPVH